MRDPDPLGPLPWPRKAWLVILLAAVLGLPAAAALYLAAAACALVGLVRPHWAAAALDRVCSLGADLAAWVAWWAEGVGGAPKDRDRPVASRDITPPLEWPE